MGRFDEVKEADELILEKEPVNRQLFEVVRLIFRMYKRVTAYLSR